MADQLNLTILTPQKLFLEDKVDSVTVPTEAGFMTILPHHAELITNLEISILCVSKENHKTYYAIGGGVVHVSVKDNKVVLNLFSITSIKDTDIEKAKALKNQYENELNENIPDQKRPIIEENIKRLNNLIYAKDKYNK